MIVSEDVVIVDQISIYFILIPLVPVVVDSVFVDVGSGTDHRQGLPEAEQEFLILRERKSRLLHDIGSQIVHAHQVCRFILSKSHIVPDKERHLIMLLGFFQAAVLIKACQAVNDFRHVVTRFMIAEGHDDGRFCYIFLKIPDQLFIGFIRLFDQSQVALRGNGHGTLIRLVRQQNFLFESVISRRIRAVAGMILHGNLKDELFFSFLFLLKFFYDPLVC